MSDHNKLEANSGHIFESGKTYTHAQGLSCCFRQWRANDSHCRFLHGYSLQVNITFRAVELDHRNWVMNFGGLKEVKRWIEDTFDHKTLVARDDPQMAYFHQMAELSGGPILQLVEVEHVGVEAFSKMIFEQVNMIVREITDKRVYVQEVEVREHEGNFARYRLAGA